MKIKSQRWILISEVMRVDSFPIHLESHGDLWHLAMKLKQTRAVLKRSVSTDRLLVYLNQGRKKI